MNVVFIGVGANLGDPILQILDARRLLNRIEAVNIQAQSAYYLTEPVGFQDQPFFINCVWELQAHLQPLELLNELQRIETQLGRQRVKGNQNAPRRIDLDILLYQNLNIDHPRLQIPHPRLTERRFVLEPLLELLDIDDSMAKGFTADFVSKLTTDRDKLNQETGQSIYRLTC
ncbi:MAG: 2-amino-4-hydroxy-6-hydroxymethyldihydropteridine diphosphokinase [Pseudomonadota bacterium]